MLIAFTGHRPNKLGGYNNATNKRCEILEKINHTVRKLQGLEDVIDVPVTPIPVTFIVGMALGVDQWAAEYALTQGIAYDAYAPFIGQESKWPADAQVHYMSLLNKARSRKFVCPPGYAAWKMQVRNKAMVDDCDQLIAIWDGTSGGTANCVQYSMSVSKVPIIIKP